MPLVGGSRLAVGTLQTKAADWKFRFVTEPHKGISRFGRNLYFAVGKVFVAVGTAQDPSRHLDLLRFLGSSSA